MSEPEFGAPPGVSPPGMAPSPHFEVRLAPPDLAPWLGGNIGVPGFTSLVGAAAGPHVVITALMHGNEFAGAVVLDRILRAGFVPLRGRLTLGFINLAAFSRFDPRNPTLSRFVDEDLNRVWDPAVLGGPRRSCELDRARVVLPVIAEADVVLDLHSMLWPSDPLVLCGPSRRGRELALAMGVPGLVVADKGHASGPRLIDYPRFSAPDAAGRAVLVEAGQHWDPDSVTVAHAAVAALLRHVGMADEDVCLPPRLPPRLPRPAPRLAEVTDVVVAGSAAFAFAEPYRGGSVIARAGTVIATDEGAEIRTPHDDCLLVMPSLRPSRGHTAVRLARFLAG